MMRIASAVLMVCAGASAGGWEEAEQNAAAAQRGIVFSKRLAQAWLDQADPRSGLIPRNLTQSWFWNARDAAADNFPFFLLTAHITDSHHLKRATLHMLEQEQKLTNRLDRLPDDFLLDRQGFRDGEYQLDQLIFGAAEYSKDGLVPITEWLGPGPWLDRMTGMVEDIWKHAPYDSQSGRIPSRILEVNGDLLQVCSRLYWITGEARFRDWAFRLADYYLLEEDLLKAARMQFDDHSCEVIGGLSEAYVVAARTDPERRRRYQPRIHAILDRALEIGRNRDGLFYNVVNPVTGGVINDDLTDNWGYNYNAFLTVAEVDQEARYRQAVESVLRAIPRYRDFAWEGGGADGYADSIEGGLNLLNRIPDPDAWRWVDDSMKILLAKQRADGLMEGWHGDGNSIRTALLWVLWKTQGVTAAPWRNDVRLGAAALEGGGIRLFVKCEFPWRGRLRCDRPRHREYFHMPFDYARINQFPEWFTVEAGKKYRVTRRYATPEVVSGRDLHDFAIELPAHGEAWLTIVPE